MRRNRFTASVSVLVLSLGLTNCTTIRDECGEQIWACTVAGLAVVAAVAYAAQEDYESGTSGGSGSYSDARLKRDIQPAGVLPNGVRLYSFRYWNDDRSFVGVMAQDLLSDARFRHAVSADASGFYVVDLKALGLGIQGDAEAFRNSGQSAAAAMAAVL